MSFSYKLFVILFFATASSITFAESSVTLKQANSPLTIKQYVTAFQEEVSRDRYTSGHPDQIMHSVTYSNTSTKNIVALQIGLASFDAFNGFMGRFSGWSNERLAVGESKKGEWMHRPYATFSFKSYGTGVAYVNAVRFEDGSIWHANLIEILSEMQKFEKTLKTEDLVEKREK
jgi:hypothetical protein